MPDFQRLYPLSLYLGTIFISLSLLHKSEGQFKENLKLEIIELKNQGSLYLRQCFQILRLLNFATKGGGGNDRELQNCCKLIECVNSKYLPLTLGPRNAK